MWKHFTWVARMVGRSRARGDASCEQVSVEVTGRLRPLPLVGVLAAALGEADGELVVVRVRVTERARPEWLEGSYADWVSMWG